MKYRVVEQDGRYVVQEKETLADEWCELMDEEDNVLSFAELEDAKFFCEYLKEINDALKEKKPNVLYEI